MMGLCFNYSGKVVCGCCIPQRGGNAAWKGRAHQAERRPGRSGRRSDIEGKVENTCVVVIG